MPLALPHPASRTIRIAALGTLVGTIAGCQGVTGIQPAAQVRVVDASPDAPPLDIHQNSAAALYNVGFGTVSSYIPTDPGTYKHAAFTAGTQQQLASVRASLAAGTQYTVLAGNVAANLQMSVLKDESTPAPPGQIALRFLDQTTRAGAVDLYLLPPGTAPITVSAIVTGATFGSNSGYLNTPAGTYSILAYPAGTVPTNSAAPAYTGAQVVYPSGAARTIILIDQPLAPHSLQLLTASDYDPTGSS